MFHDCGKEFRERERKLEEKSRFHRNIALKGSIGTNNPKTCHHPITNTRNVYIDETGQVVSYVSGKTAKYTLEWCRDCGKTINLKKKGK